MGLERTKIDMDNPMDIQTKIQERKLWLEELSKTTIYRLACKQLKREGKLIILHQAGGITYYEVEPIEVVLKGFELLKLVDKKFVGKQVKNIMERLNATQ